jgi:hypothetical protein
MLVLAGDFFINGPRPAEVLERIRGLDVPAIIGNTDEDMLEGDWPASVWARERVGAAGLDFIRGLPGAVRVTPPGGTAPEEDLLIVHSTPRSIHDLLILALQPGFTSFKTLTPPEEAYAMLSGARAGLIVYGHIHYFSSAQIDDQRIGSIGSVGFPFDGDTRAAYAILDWDGGRWSLTPRRVEYDCEQVAREIEHSGMPRAWRYSRMIREARWLPPE